jgi:hypothetical protein
LEFSNKDLESVDFGFKSSLVSTESLVLSSKIGILFLEGGIVVLQLSVSLGEVLDDDLGLLMRGK